MDLERVCVMLLETTGAWFVDELEKRGYATENIWENARYARSASFLWQIANAQRTLVPNPPHPLRRHIQGDRVVLQALRQPRSHEAFRFQCRARKGRGLAHKVPAESFSKDKEGVRTEKNYSRMKVRFFSSCFFHLSSPIQHISCYRLVL